ncbi:hypothetical protein E2C01_092063 [Portunus trituberculatus]|uniref:Uncharacterized protein n=1 Tax=Portunus trituberculatus TaxID=210409 RepID=A0A5B7JQC8_PORTR|nr:hypothetical protein [Portunus trituberculatus]
MYQYSLRQGTNIKTQTTVVVYVDIHFPREWSGWSVDGRLDTRGIHHLKRPNTSLLALQANAITLLTSNHHSSSFPLHSVLPTPSQSLQISVLASQINAFSSLPHFTITRLLTPSYSSQFHTSHTFLALTKPPSTYRHSTMRSTAVTIPLFTSSCPS